MVKIRTIVNLYYTGEMCVTLWFNDTLKNNTIRCKKLATITSGRKNVARPVFRRK